jgi:hypothetical protein
MFKLKMKRNRLQRVTLASMRNVVSSGRKTHQLLVRDLCSNGHAEIKAAASAEPQSAARERLFEA